MRRKRLKPPSPPFSAGGGSMAKRQVRTRRNVSPIDRVNRERKSALATREIAGKTVAPVRTRHWKHQPTRLAFLRMSTNCLSAKIGRASCRERGGQHVLIAVVAGSLNKQQLKQNI